MTLAFNAIKSQLSEEVVTAEVFSRFGGSVRSSGVLHQLRCQELTEGEAVPGGRRSSRRLAVRYEVHIQEQTF